VNSPGTATATTPAETARLFGSMKRCSGVSSTPARAAPAPAPSPAAAAAPRGAAAQQGGRGGSRAA